jgi:hypothetical protein
VFWAISLYRSWPGKYQQRLVAGFAMTLIAIIADSIIQACSYKHKQVLGIAA